MKKQKKTPARQRAEAAYNKERGRIKRQINRMKAAGYRFQEDVTPQSLTQLGKVSTQKIKSLTKKMSETKTSQLYAKSSALSETGEIVSGTEAKKERAREAAKKAAETRNKKKLLKGPTDGGGGIINEGVVVYRRITDLINYARQAAKGHSYMVNNADDLEELLDEQIEEYGFNNVMQSLAQAPGDAWEYAQAAIYYKDAGRTSAARRALAELIKGEILTPEEQIKYDDSGDDDYYSDYEEM